MRKANDRTAERMSKGNVSNDRVGRTMSAVNANKDNKAGKTEVVTQGVWAERWSQSPLIR